MPFAKTPLSVPEGGCYETDQKVERLDFAEEDGDTFIVLHFEAPVTGRSASIRAPIAREIYDAYTGRVISN